MASATDSDTEVATASAADTEDASEKEGAFPVHTLKGDYYRLAMTIQRQILGDACWRTGATGFALPPKVSRHLQSELEQWKKAEKDVLPPWPLSPRP